MNVRLTVAASLSVLLTAGAASAAQPWLEDRRYGEGIGIRAGAFELHPGIAAEFGYDSNFFQRADTKDPNTIDYPGPVDAWRLRITPSLTLSSVSARRRGSEAVGSAPMLNLSANLYGSYSEIFGNSQVSDQRRFDIGAGAKADIAPSRPLGGDLYADFVRNGEPSNQPGLDHSFDRDQVRGGFGMSWRPGGGLFDWRLGYEAAYSYFEDSPYNQLENIQHSVLTRGRWRILPRSGFVYDARYTFIRYQRANAPLPNGDDLQARLGFSGLVTNRLAFLILGGWNATFYENQSNAQANAGTANPTSIGRNYDGYVGQAELKFFVMGAPEGDSAQTGLSSITAGFTRDATNSYLGSFYTRDRGYLSVDYFLGGVFVANLTGGVSRYSFPTVNAANRSFDQTHLDGRLFTEYRLSDTFGINFTVLYDKAIGKGPNPNGVLIGATPAGAPYYDNLEYQRIQALLGLRLFW
jgi:hypothetical protein